MSYNIHCSLKYSLFSVDHEYTYDQTIMNKDSRRGRAQYEFTRDTVWQETFEGKDFHKFHSFVAVRESFLSEIWGHGVLWHGNLQKFSFRKSYFSLIRESFLLKVSLYMVPKNDDSINSCT